MYRRITLGKKNFVSFIKNCVLCCVIFKFETICQRSRYLAQKLSTILFYHWLRSLYAAHHGAWRETERPQNQELVTKRGTTSVACWHVFKHCSFKTTDFKPLKLKQQSYMRAPSLSVWEERFFFFADFERLHKHLYASESRLCQYPH